MPLLIFTLTCHNWVNRLTEILLSPNTIAKSVRRSLFPLALEHELLLFNKDEIDETYCTAILINFLRIFNRLTGVAANKTSVVVQYCTSLNLLSRISKLAGTLPRNWSLPIT